MENVEVEIAAGVQTEILNEDRELRLRSLKIRRWLRTDEVALYLGTSQGAVRNLVMRGKLRPRKFNGRNYHDREEIDRRIETSNASAQPEPNYRRKKWRLKK